jgi:hypothetical protein
MMMPGVFSVNPPSNRIGYLFRHFATIFLAALSLYVSPLRAQERCGTVEYMNTLRQEGKIMQTDAEFESWLARRIQERQGGEQLQRTQSDTYQIPVVVHIIHNGEPVGVGTNISDAQIHSQIAVLNRDFNRQNADANQTPAAFATVAGSMNIEFVLAKRDPNGLPTTGINRVLGTKTSWTMSDNAIFKALSFWNSNDYFNIWVIRFSGSTLGYAQYPVSNLPGLAEVQGGTAATDGIVVDYTVFGSVEDGNFTGIDPNYNKGRTATHEAGHFLGLRHIWGDANCGNDFVNDTPFQQTSTTGCPSHPATTVCFGGPVVKMFQNYMDYTFDACMNLFTAGQVVRMETILTDPSVPRRSSLLTSPALLDPNCDITDVALQGIESPGTITCAVAGNPLIRILNRGCSPVGSVNVQFQLNNGQKQTTLIAISPALPVNQITTIQLPVINFQSGANNLQITLLQANGINDDFTDNNTISRAFLIDNQQEMIPYINRFNTLNWPAISPQGDLAWELQFTNVHENSATVQAFNNGTTGSETWLASPVLDFSRTLKASVFFDYAYAFNGTRYDRLKVVASTDCGQTYPHVLFDKTGPNLATTNSAAAWTPTVESEWRRQYINLNAFAEKTNIRLAWVFINSRGNNFYLDNINYYLSDNPNPVDVGDALFSVYWDSPTSAAVTFNLEERMAIGIQVYDILGRSYLDITEPDILNQTFPVDLGGANAGIYLMRIRVGSAYYVQKFYLP